MSQSHELTYRVDKIPYGYLAQCVEFPQLVAQAKTRPKLDKEMGMTIDGYLKACPSAYKALKKSVGYGKYEIQKP